MFQDRVYDPLADGRRHGIPTGPERWGDDLVRAACGALQIGNGQTHGLGWTYAMFAPAVAQVPMGTAGPSSFDAPPQVTFRFGGEPRFRGRYRVRDGLGAARIRSAPLMPDGAVVRTVLAGADLPFHVAQTTLTGASVAGVRRWMGDATGNRWVHHALIEAIE